MHTIVPMRCRRAHSYSGASTRRFGQLVWDRFDRRPFQIRKSTQADVAKLAKVSQATVSYVLNGNSAISVPKATSQRILAAVDEFGYVPNGIVRSPRTQRLL